jgi:hypothetical protein
MKMKFGFNNPMAEFWMLLYVLRTRGRRGRVGAADAWAPRTRGRRERVGAADAWAPKKRGPRNQRKIRSSLRSLRILR